MGAGCSGFLIQNSARETLCLPWFGKSIMTSDTPFQLGSNLDPGRPLWYGQEILLRGHPISLPLEPYLGAACGDEQGLRRVGLSSAGLPGCVRLDTREKYTSSCSTLSPALNLASGDPWCPVLGARPSTKKHTVGSPNHCFQI